ncbi:MAG: (2Fe-2S)-binding protein [Actinomycetota bacterium]|nr:(2Fe-2S)-binding protein [Actinomycetota bacterium]
MKIDRCVCTGRTFAEALERAGAEGWDIDGLRTHLGVGGHCGLCRPYVRRALATGETEFHTILTDDGPRP